MQTQITLEQDTLEVKEVQWGNAVEEPLARIDDSFYGWTLNTPEWALTLQATARQDGNISWLVALVQVDGQVDSEAGLTRYGAETAKRVGAAIRQLTKGWIDPIEVFVSG